jgi:hypothetical protein
MKSVMEVKERSSNSSQTGFQIKDCFKAVFSYKEKRFCVCATSTKLQTN